jgi:predicted deacetylase
MNKKSLIWIIPLGLILSILSIRILSLTEIDDISPQINCNKNYLEKSDTLWIIPEFKQNSISENKTWCKEILNLNKTLGLHGINHNYKEFERNISEEQLQKAIKEFELCFGDTPKIFKAPQLALSKENKLLLEKYNLTIKGKTNQVLHKVYHCEDESGTSKGLFPNWIIKLF